MNLTHTSSSATDDHDIAVELADLPRNNTARLQNGFFGTGIFQAWRSAYLPQDNWQDRALLLSAHAHDELQCQAVFGIQRFPGFSALSLGGYYWPFRSVWPAKQLQQTQRDTLATALATRLAARGGWPVLRFGPISADDRLINAVMSQLQVRGWRCLEKPLGTGWLVAVPETEQAFEAIWGKHLTDRVAYYTRRLNKSAAVRIVSNTSATTPDWQRLYADCVTIEQNSWVAKTGGDTKFVGAGNEQFWRSVFTLPGAPLFQICILYVGERPAAFSLNLDQHDTRHIIANTYDDEFKSNSPGTILTAHVLKDTLASGLRFVDWGAGDSGYKQRWGATEGIRLLDRIAIRPGLYGRLLCYLLKNRGGYT